MLNLWNRCYKDSWLFHYGSHMKEFCGFWFLITTSLVGISHEVLQRILYDTAGLGLWFPSKELPPPACISTRLWKGTRSPEEDQHKVWAEGKQSTRLGEKNNATNNQQQKQNGEQTAHEGGENQLGKVAVKLKGKQINSRKGCQEYPVLRSDQGGWGLIVVLCLLVILTKNIPEERWGQKAKFGGVKMAERQGREKTEIVRGSIAKEGVVTTVGSGECIYAEKGPSMIKC